MATARENPYLKVIRHGGSGLYDSRADVVEYCGPNNAGRGRLTDKMALVVASLAQGKGHSEAALAAGVSRRTVIRWRHRPEFKAAMGRWLGDRALVVESLRAILADPTVHARLKLRASARLERIVRDRQAASSRSEDLVARNERIANAVMLTRPLDGPTDGS